MNRREFSGELALGLGAMAFGRLPALSMRQIEIGGGKKMQGVRLDVAPTSIPEWDREDEQSAVLGGEELHKADDTQAKAMLDQITLQLPTALNWVELLKYAKQHPAVGGLRIPPDSRNFSFYAMELPIAIILPNNQRLVRLRLVLDLHVDTGGSEAAVAYDVFPAPEIDVKKLATGEINLDVSKALKFILTSTGAVAAAPIADCLGIKLNMPFEWSTTSVRLQSSGRMSSHVEWYVSDDSIQKGFAPATIVRAPKNAHVTIDATMAGELRFAGPIGWFKTQFASPQPMHYALR